MDQRSSVRRVQGRRRRLSTIGIAALTAAAGLGGLVGPADAAGPRTDAAASRTAAAVSHTGAAAAQRAPVPRLSWGACSPAVAGFQCATAQVPLDHDRPNGPTIDLALTRVRATDPARRIGTLFVDPGGPGGSGVGFVQAVGKVLYSDEVRARFDILGFDPRGVARSTPLRCFTSQEEADAVAAPFPFPVTRAEERRWQEADRAYAQACTRNAGPVLDHMSTADVARDIDLLRRAVGDDRMTYAGYSYGSYIGSVYANLFPGKVRAVVIDGVIDPVSDATGRRGEWRTKPVDARLQSEQGAYQTLQEFLRLCDLGGQRCAFSGGNPKVRYDRLAARVRREPVELRDNSGGTMRVTYAVLVITTLQALYAPDQWPNLAQFLQDVDDAANSRRTVASHRVLQRLQLAGAGASRAPYTQGAEGFFGVWCTDSRQPDRFDAWRRAARAADRRWPYFGRAWNWSSSICARWPGEAHDRYLGPFNRRTAGPVLVIGTRYDPATRYQDAVSTARILRRGRLLTVAGWGHTSLFKSSCASAAASRYLLSGRLPAAGTVCPVDVVPFSAGAARARAVVPDLTWQFPGRPLVR
jgi:pimeloyl-ACP methyl ester carboxylesterase